MPDYPRPFHIPPKDWCVIHFSYRRGSGQRCYARWGDPFALDPRRCHWQEKNSGFTTFAGGQTDDETGGER